MRTAVRKLAAIGSALEKDPSAGFPEEKIVSALQAAGFHKDYFSMEDFLEALDQYQNKFGRDRDFHHAAKLAYKGSDGEYAGGFELKFPDLRELYLKEERQTWRERVKTGRP